ncbi:MAG: hypothetical protein ACOX0E_05850 [Syntrophomonadaceae bacterium]|jgi:hypothetical protein
MERAVQSLLVLLLVSVVIMGLKISHHNINSLTGVDQGPIIGINVSDGNLSLAFAGQTHDCSFSRLNYMRDELICQGQDTIYEAGRYFKRIWLIFRALIANPQITI